MSLDKQLDKLVSSFVSDLRKIVAESTRQEIVDAVRKAVGGAGKVSGRAVRIGDVGGRSRKRSPEVMAKQQAKLLAHIKGNPDQRMEQIVAGIGIETNLLQPLIKRLLEEKRIKAKGKARGTTYTAA